MYSKEELSAIIEEYIHALPFPEEPDTLYEPIVYSLGKGGKHVKVSLGPVSLLAFGAADMFSGGCGWLDGWVYKPRLDTWRNVTSLQFVLEKMGARESKTE